MFSLHHGEPIWLNEKNVIKGGAEGKQKVLLSDSQKLIVYLTPPERFHTLGFIYGKQLHNCNYT